jgi:hydrogenase maturation protease
MSGFRRSLEASLVGRVCVVGVGNVDRADDGAGVFVAETLQAAGLEDVIVAGTTPERWMTALSAAAYDTVLFVDAVSVPAEPGAAVLMEAAEIQSQFPQVSTHRISLGTLATLIAGESGARVLLLGVRPASLAEGPGLSAAVEGTARVLAGILAEVLAEQPRAALRPLTPELAALLGTAGTPTLLECEA